MTHLPLSENADDQPRAGLGPVREEEIARVIQRFYERAREDELLGPVFDAHVQDWDKHFVTMQDFWASAVYKAGRYAGRPMVVHRELGGLTTEHFEHWLTLWVQTVRDTVTSDIGQDLIDMAIRMAHAMRVRLVAGY